MGISNFEREQNSRYPVKRFRTVATNIIVILLGQGAAPPSFRINLMPFFHRNAVKFTPDFTRNEPSPRARLGDEMIVGETMNERANFTPLVLPEKNNYDISPPCAETLDGIATVLLSLKIRYAHKWSQSHSHDDLKFLINCS